MTRLAFIVLILLAAPVGCTPSSLRGSGGGGGGGSACAALPHTVPDADSGECLFRCAAGWGDCNGLAADGCEADLTQSGNCGACGVACAGAQQCGVGCDESYSCFPSVANCPSCTAEPAANPVCAVTTDGGLPVALSCEPGADLPAGCEASAFGPSYLCCPAGKCAGCVDGDGGCHAPDPATCGVGGAACAACAGAAGHECLRDTCASGACGTEPAGYDTTCGAGGAGHCLPGAGSCCAPPSHIVVTCPAESDPTLCFDDCAADPTLCSTSCGACPTGTSPMADTGVCVPN